MLPRLQSEERLARANILLATEGQSMTDYDRGQFLGDLERGTREQRPGHLATREEMLAEGIIIVEEELGDG